MTLALTQWRSCHRFLNTPSALETEKKGSAIYAKFFCPCTDALSFTIPGEHSVVATITHVFFDCDPTDVPWRVVPVCINAVKLVSLTGVLAYLCSYFSGKDFVFSPSSVHLDTACAVIFVTIQLWVVAALSSALPAATQRCAYFAMMSTYSPSSSVSHIKEVS